MEKNWFLMKMEVKKIEKRKNDWTNYLENYIL